MHKILNNIKSYNGLSLLSDDGKFAWVLMVLIAIVMFSSGVIVGEREYIASYFTSSDSVGEHTTECSLGDDAVLILD